MKLGLIVDEPLLKSMRVPGFCEWCKVWCRMREPHHVFGRGGRSWKRIDLPQFLMALGSTLGFECRCHQKMTNACKGHGIEDQLKYLAERDGTSPARIRTAHDRILRTYGKGGR